MALNRWSFSAGRTKQRMGRLFAKQPDGKGMGGFALTLSTGPSWLHRAAPNYHSGAPMATSVLSRR
jgi:hypothetical protein